MGFYWNNQLSDAIAAEPVRLPKSNGTRAVDVPFTSFFFSRWLLTGVFQSLVIPEKFQHILRILSTNIDGKRKVMFAMTAIKGIGRRFSNIVLKKADVDLNKRAGECTDEEVCMICYSLTSSPFKTVASVWEYYVNYFT